MVVERIGEHVEVGGVVLRHEALDVHRLDLAVPNRHGLEHAYQIPTAVVGVRPVSRPQEIVDAAAEEAIADRAVGFFGGAIYEAVAQPQIIVGARLPLDDDEGAKLAVVVIHDCGPARHHPARNLPFQDANQSHPY